MTEGRLSSFRGKVATTVIIAAGVVGSVSVTQTTPSWVDSSFTGATTLHSRLNESRQMPSREAGDERAAGSHERVVQQSDGADGRLAAPARAKLEAVAACAFAHRRPQLIWVFDGQW